MTGFAGAVETMIGKAPAELGEMAGTDLQKPQPRRFKDATTDATGAGDEQSHLMMMRNDSPDQEFAGSHPAGFVLRDFVRDPNQDIQRNLDDHQAPGGGGDGASAGDSTLATTLEKLRIDKQAIGGDKSRVTPALLASVRRDLEAIEQAKAGDIDPSALKALDSVEQALFSTQLAPTDDQLKPLQAALDAVLVSQGVSRPTAPAPVDPAATMTTMAAPPSNPISEPSVAPAVAATPTATPTAPSAPAPTALPVAPPDLPVSAPAASDPIIYYSSLEPAAPPTTPPVTKRKEPRGSAAKRGRPKPRGLVKLGRHGLNAVGPGHHSGGKPRR